MVEIMTGLLSDARVLITGAIIVMALLFVMATWARTKSAVPTIGALLLGVVVIWGVSNIPVLQEEINEDIQRHRGQ